jgi:hypothetical protein
MKYIKTYEAKTSIGLQEEIDKFFSNYNRTKNYGSYYANVYKIPSIIHEEFSLLYYYYDDYCRFHYFPLDILRNQLKNYIKKYAIDSIHKKMIENPELYIELKGLLYNNKNFDDPRRLDATVKYIFFTIRAAVNTAPEYIKSAEKYNL